MLVGRDSEIAQLEGALRERKHALLVISSKPRMGRSLLLQEFRTRAENQNWRVLPVVSPERGSPGVLSINRDTNEGDFLGKVGAVTAPEPSVQAAQSYPGPKGPQSTPQGTAETRGFSMVSAQTGQIELTKQDPPQALQEESRGAAPSSRPRPKDPGAQELAGTVVLIDGYQPSKRFEAWLLQEYLPELRRAVLPVVLVVAGYSGDVGALAQSAGRTVSLGPLPAGPVIDYFRVLNQSLAVKMEDEEIQAYSRASAEDPRLIDALNRLLQLK